MKIPLAVAILATLTSAKDFTRPEAYVLSGSGSVPAPSAPPSEPPTLPAPVARLILLQRLAAPVDLRIRDALSSSTSPDDALDAISAFGGPRPPPFSLSEKQANGVLPRQVLVLVEDVGEAAVEELRAAIPRPDPSFVFTAAVSRGQNTRLLEEAQVPLAGRRGGSPAPIRCLGRESADECTDGAVVLRLDAKQPEDVQTFFSAMSIAREPADSDFTVLLFPEADSALTALTAYSSRPIRRHQSESVIGTSSTETTATDSEAIIAVDSAPQAPSPSLSGKKTGFSSAPIVVAALAQSSPVARCFDSFDACVEATANCSSPRGQCRNRWGDDDAPAGQACFACHCLISPSGTQFGGDRCEKVDVSTPFWLLGGTSVVLVAVVAGSIGMLYSMGQEMLPGVIGAGVVRGR